MKRYQQRMLLGFSLLLFGVFAMLGLAYWPAAAWQYPYPIPPATYYGQILDNPGFTPVEGMAVTAWVSDTLCGAAETQVDGAHIVYVLHVEADWDAAPGCGMPDREVRFEVDATPMLPIVLWDNNQLHEVNLSIADVIPPQIVTVTPLNDAVDVVRNQPVDVLFSEAMDIGTVVTLITPTLSLTRTWSNGDTRLTLDHNTFTASTRYTATVSGSDVVGNPMVASYTWSFTTGTEFAPEADLALGKVREGSGVVTAGNTITYTFTITNHGPTTPVSATVVDTFSDARALASVSGMGCVWAGEETVTCTVTGLATNAPSALTIVVTTNDAYNGTLSNSATVTPVGDIVDSNPVNDTAGPVAVLVRMETGGERYIYLPLVLRNF